MDADNLNKWLTLVANIGVVIGLVLLIYEIRQNSELVRAQIHQARSDSKVWIRLRLHEALTPDFRAEVERLAADAE